MEFQIIDKLDEIKSLLKEKSGNRWIGINDVCRYTSLSASTIRRAVAKGELKCSKRCGKLLFYEKAVRKWLDG